MMPHLGVLAQVHAQASLEVFERDCLISLGTCVSAKGTGKAGKACFKYAIRSANLNQSGEMLFGALRLFPLTEGETALVKVEPEKGFDLGAGPGKAIEREVRGGTVGLILDARGRPLSVSQSQMKQWVDALELYPPEKGTRR